MKPLKINRHLETEIVHFSLHLANVMLIILQFVGPMKFMVASILFNDLFQRHYFGVNKFGSLLLGPNLMS